MKNNNVTTAIEKIIYSAVKHSEASENGDYKTANKNFIVIQKAVTFLRGNEGLYELEKLLSHKEICVRLAVASFFLAHNKDKAISVLENIISQEIPHKSFEAQLVLDEFNKGNITL